MNQFFQKNKYIYYYQKHYLRESFADKSQKTQINYSYKKMIKNHPKIIDLAISRNVLRVLPKRRDLSILILKDNNMKHPHQKVFINIMNQTYNHEKFKAGACFIDEWDVLEGWKKEKLIKFCASNRSFAKYFLSKYFVYDRFDRLAWINKEIII